MIYVAPYNGSVMIYVVPYNGSKNNNNTAPVLWTCG